MKKKCLFALISVVSSSLISAYDRNVARWVITVLANTIFWVGLLQIDHMFWRLMDFYGDELGIHGFDWACKAYWIPELRISWKNAFILFCAFIIATFYIFFGLMLL